jgi:hypothetical protein
MPMVSLLQKIHMEKSDVLSVVFLVYVLSVVIHGLLTLFMFGSTVPTV